MKRALLVLVALAAGCNDVAPAPSGLNETTRPAVVPESPRVALLPADSREVVRTSRLPLLLPRDPALLSSAIVTSGPHFSALSVQLGGLSVSISGTDVRHDLAEEEPPLPAPHQVRGRPATFTVNDGIRSVSWDEANVAWIVDVECYDVEGDARCADDDYLTALTESLELVGGVP